MVFFNNLNLADVFVVVSFVFQNPGMADVGIRPVYVLKGEGCKNPRMRLA